jgi:hypothetical protein
VFSVNAPFITGEHIIPSAASLLTKGGTSLCQIRKHAGDDVIAQAAITYAAGMAGNVQLRTPDGIIADTAEGHAHGLTTFQGVVLLAEDLVISNPAAADTGYAAFHIILRAPDHVITEPSIHETTGVAAGEDCLERGTDPIRAGTTNDPGSETTSNCTQFQLSDVVAEAKIEPEIRQGKLSPCLVVYLVGSTIGMNHQHADSGISGSVNVQGPLSMIYDLDLIIVGATSDPQ